MQTSFDVYMLCDSIKKIGTSTDITNVLKDFSNTVVDNLDFDNCGIFRVLKNELSVIYSKGDIDTKLASKVVSEQYSSTILNAKRIDLTKDSDDAHIVRSLLVRPMEYFIIYSRVIGNTEEVKQKLNLVDTLSTIIFTKIEHFKMQSLLKKSNFQMENQIKLQIEEIKESNLQLSKTNEIMKQLQHCVSHDLREPIRNLATYNALAKQKISKGSSAEEVQELIDKSLDQTYRLDTMVSEIKHSFANGRKNIIVETLMLEGMIEVVKKNLNQLIDETNSKLIITKSSAFESSSALLKIILQNLISNAIYYRDSDRSPLIEIWVDVEEIVDTIYVKDNGIGIAEENLERIFLPYERGDVSRNGSGLGLATCKKMCQYLGGEIEVESTIGKGTTFIIRLPKACIKPIGNQLPPHDNQKSIPIAS